MSEDWDELERIGQSRRANWNGTDRRGRGGLAQKAFTRTLQAAVDKAHRPMQRWQQRKSPRPISLAPVNFR